MKVRINHVALRQGPSGEWGYALVGSPEIRGFDTVELRGLDAAMLRLLEARLKALKGGDQIVTCTADFDVEERLEEFVTKSGEAASKRVARLYFASVAKWAIEVKPDLTGNLADILGPVDPVVPDTEPF